MGKTRKAKQEQQALAKKKQRNRALLIAAGVLCVVAVIVVIVVVARPAPAETLEITPDAGGDLRIPMASVPRSLGYVEYGGRESLLLWRDGDGVIRTALDTCEECYGTGDVHYTLRGDTLTCGLCGTTQPVTNLGTESWGGCRPLSITPAMREDSADEIVVPAAVLAYAEDMLDHWDAGEFGVSLATYGTPDAHVH